MLSEKPKKTTSKSSATSSSCNSSSSTTATAQEYDKALKELKLQWMKYVMKHYHCLYFINNSLNVAVKIMIPCLSVCLCNSYTYALMSFCHRKKVLDISEMESEFGNDLDFLMARVSCCVDDKSVSKHTCTYVYTLSQLRNTRRAVYQLEV